ncbi:N-acetylmuramoyl-L-alanine amidase [Jeotgalibacillus soli]|uniref:N-acetylmuramoyl-L-alanine amidase n=1 Tax=Jeotgalibacillus soli TaxID=889306 RepID=A0A0C2VM34_9BACL|nr:N-acetylmuramoyl-L-alanine amidase [Jeotgalibacillus soli]KIL49972.1 N-acetylmuramoyl-L-alanine amidase [Jeotgalibacillus soli]
MTTIIIDAGHGYDTPGKRSPDGMVEYAFNRAVATETMKQLHLANITTIQTHDDKRDVPLAQRTAIANQAQADYFISIHANAFGDGSWNDIHGIETYVHQNASPNAKQLASAVHKRLIAETARRDRGIKTANFHVLRETRMPAILVECGFMTNRSDKALLASESYRKLCGQAIAQGVLQQLGIEMALPPSKSASEMYRVQAGAFTNRARADSHVKALKKAGFDAFVSSSK